MNIEKISDYIRQGEKKSSRIGVEIEHFIVDGSGESVNYNDGVCVILERISQFFDEKFYSDGNLISLSNGRYHLTLEPAAQLEISIEPLEDIDAIRAEYDDFISIIQPVLDDFGYRLVTLGYQPVSKVADLPLIPKKRYMFMDEYFRHTGKYGINMMRGTASSQVSIDYTDEQDCAKKFRTANILSPIFAMICDNSPVFEGESYNGRMIRAKIWSDLDNDRCGIAKCSMDKFFSYSSYAKYIANAPAILIEENGESVYTGSKKIKDIYKNRELTTSDVEHLLSMFFPAVRLKQYIEIRPADSMPIEYSLSYAAFVKGIFESIGLVYECLGMNDITLNDVLSASEELIKHGFDAFIYGRKVTEILDFLVQVAVRGLNDKDKKHIRPIFKIISERRTLKDNLGRNEI